MQEEFKDRILHYLTNNYEVEEGNITLTAAENEMLSSNDIYTTLETLTNAYVKGRMTDKDNKCLIFYGSYGMDQTYFDGHGFILIADFNGNVIELFTTYEGGTNLPNIEYLDYAEDGTFYGITTNTSGTKYLTMLNNFTLTLTGSYSVKFRQSYQLDGDLQNASVVNMKVKKKIGNAKYVFVGQRGSNPDAITTMIVSTAEIVVGGTNTWTHQTYSTNIKYYSGHQNGLAIFISWLDEDYYVKIGGVNSSTGYYLEYYIKNSGTMTTYTTSIVEDNLTLLAKGGIIMPNYQTTYVGNTDGENFYIYKILNNTASFLLYEAPTNNPGGYSYYFKLALSENKIYFAYSCTYYTIGMLGLLDNDNIYLIGQIPQGIFEYTELYSTSQYNMNNIYIDNPNIDLEKFVLIYNASNYVGTNYQALNSMVPNSGILYDENDKIIYARNLYNKVINANTTESTIQIPNIYLNDTIIEKQNLISQTNSILNINNEQINKNIYESVYINFFNTIGISNQNDQDNIIINTPGASKLNMSISGNNNDYNNTKIGYYKINYSDDTSETNYLLPPTGYKQKTISGNNDLYINDALEKEIISYKVDGATEQDGTPTPDNPVEIETMPSIINLFDKNNANILNIPVNGNTLATSENAKSLYIPITGGKTYTIQKIKSSRFRVETTQIMPAVGVSIDNYLANDNGTTITINTSLTANYLLVYYFLNGTDTLTEQQILDSIQIEEGTITHEYMPYGYWLKIKDTGKNLFNPTIPFSDYYGVTATIENQEITFSGTSTSGKATIIANADIDSGSYIVSFEELSGTHTSGKKIYIDFMNNTTKIGGVNFSAGGTKTITINEYVNNFRIGFDSGDIFTDYKMRFQIEKGSTATTYEPYKERTTLIDVSKPNLFDKDNYNVLDAYINSSGTMKINNSVDRTIYIPCKPNTTYTVKKMLQGTSSKNRFCIATYKNVPVNNSTCINYKSYSNGTNVIEDTIWTGNNANYLAFFCYSNDTLTTFDEMLASVKIYEGVTPYYELCKIGDYKDELVVENGRAKLIRRIGKVVLNGKESWDYYSSGQYFYNTSILTNYPRSDEKKAIAFKSNYFIDTERTSILATQDNIMILVNQPDRASEIDLKMTSLGTSTSDFKTWLSTHNTIVYYVLAEEETIDLGEYNIELYENINNFSLVNSLTTNTQLTYKTPYILTYVIDLYVPSNKNISNIELLSNDKNMIYQTIDTSNLQNNKYYKITQDVHIE